MRHLMTILLTTWICTETTFGGDSNIFLDFLPTNEIGIEAKSAAGPNGQPAVEVNCAAARTSTFTLLDCKQPKISAQDYQVRGQVKYSHVVGDGYLELLNYFDDPLFPYFTRTLVDTGPMGKLNGTSEWREFILPFHADPGMTPKRLTLNVVLPKTGTVLVTQPVLERRFDNVDGSTVALDFLPVDELSRDARLAKGPNGESAIEVASGLKLKSFTLIVFDHPPAFTNDYEVRGLVNCNGITGEGYLEILSDFGKPAASVTRSKAAVTTMTRLSGSPEWREFTIPVHVGAGMVPKRLTLIATLPDDGQMTVTRPILVTQFQGAKSEWWSAKFGTMIGAFGGSLLGILGGLMGALMTWNQTRGLVRRVYPAVLVSCYAIAISGIVALATQQPYHVYFPTLLLGGISAIVLQCNYFSIYHRVQEDELRKMTALDVN